MSDDVFKLVKNSAYVDAWHQTFDLFQNGQI